MSQNIVESLSTTIRNMLSLQQQPPSVTSTTSSISDLLDFQSTKPKSVTFQSTNQPSVPTPTQNPTTTTQSQSINNDLHQILKSMKPEVKLQFQIYKPSSDYEQWKSKCILKASMHEVHGSIVCTGNNGELIFNPAMTEKQSSMLFLIMHDALGQEAQKLYGSINMKKPNGLHLWKLLDKHYLNIDTLVTNQETLTEEFAPSNGSTTRYLSTNSAQNVVIMNSKQVNV
jgi:hypothetical protein